MADDYFVLKAEIPQEPGQPWYHIRGLKTSYMTNMEQLPPTQASIAAGHLEWLVPNTQYNQGYISRFYSHFTVKKQGEEMTGLETVKKMPGLPEPLDARSPEETPEVPEGPGDAENLGTEEPPNLGEPEPGDIDPNEYPEGPDGAEPAAEKVDYFAKPTDPRKIKLLKAQLQAKLTEIEVTAPKSSTLRTLQGLLKRADTLG